MQSKTGYLMTRALIGTALAATMLTQPYPVSAEAPLPGVTEPAQGGPTKRAAQAKQGDQQGPNAQAEANDHAGGAGGAGETEPAGTGDQNDQADHAGHADHGEQAEQAAPSGAHSPVKLPKARKEKKPKQLEGVGIDSKLGDKIPLDLKFTNAKGQRVALGKYFKEGRPVVLNLAYLQCPQLCPMIMDGMGKAMKKMNWDLGKDYQVVTVSFDPKDGPIAAKKRQQKMLRMMGQPGDAKGWNFLVGDKKQIHALADALGFKYKKLPNRRRQFAHTAAVMILSSQGKLTRYLKGVRFPSRTLRLALVDASNGQVGSFLDQALLFCCRFSAKDTRYVATAKTIMTAGGAVTLVIFGSVLGLLFWRERKCRRDERRAGAGVNAWGADVSARGR